MTEFVIAATALNLRSQPRVEPATRRVVLPQGHRVLLVDGSDARWWQVRTELTGQDFEGWVAAEHLRPAGDWQPQTAGLEVHLRAVSDARRDSAAAHAFPLSEPGAPRAAPPRQAAQLDAIVDWLDVTRSARYQPREAATYCNVYAHDFCHIAGVYLPRVFWRPAAYAALLRGDRPEVRYGVTVSELNANALYDWLDEIGPLLGWRRCDEEGAQAAANVGKVVLICAQHGQPQRSGHISVVVPEGQALAAARDSDRRVARPVQSEAGRQLRQRWVPTSAWWRGAQYRAFGMWLCER